MPLLLLFACAPKHVAPASFDYVGTWAAREDAYALTITPGPHGLVAEVVDGQTRAPGVPVYLGVPPHVSLRYDEVDDVAYASVEPIDADTLRVDVACEKPGQRSNGRTYAYVLHRQGPAEDRSRAATAERLRARWVEVEVRENLDRLRTAELSYDAAFDGYVACDAFPRPVAALTPAPITMPEPKAGDGCTWTLGFRVDGPTRGVYAVELVPDGAGFIAHAWEDPDGDGVPTHWIATQDTPAKRAGE